MELQQDLRCRRDVPAACLFYWCMLWLLLPQKAASCTDLHGDASTWLLPPPPPKRLAHASDSLSGPRTLCRALGIPGSMVLAVSIAVFAGASSAAPDACAGAAFMMHMRRRPLCHDEQRDPSAHNGARQTRPSCDRQGVRAEHLALLLPARMPAQNDKRCRK